MDSLVGYVVLVVKDSNGHIKIFGSPYNYKESCLFAVDLIGEVNGKALDSSSYLHIIRHFHRCVQSKEIKLKVQRGLKPEIPETEYKKRALVFAIEQTGERRLAELHGQNLIQKITSHDTPAEVLALVTDNNLYVTDFKRSNSRSTNGDLNTLELQSENQNKGCDAKKIPAESKDCNRKSNRVPQNSSNKGYNAKTSPEKKSNGNTSGIFRSKALDHKMAVAMPRSNKNYRMNGGMVLPPDENTHEMEVNFPSHPRSGAGTPRSFIDVPPPTPLDGVKSGHRTSQDLEVAAEKAAGLPQPEMNFQRIHRMRESARRQKEQRERDAQVRKQMAGEGGARKIQSLQHLTAEQESNLRKQGVENIGYERDSVVENASPAPSSVLSIEDMFGALNSLSHKVNDKDSANDIAFLKQLVQQDTFQEALDLHNTLVESTTPTQSSTLIPYTKTSQAIAEHVQEELKYCDTQQANQLTKLILNPAFQGLLSAHDGSAELVQLPETPSGNPYDEISSYVSHEDEEMITRASQYTNKKVRVVRIEKTTDALGATVRSEEDGTVTIGRIVSGGMVEKSHLFHEGDELIEVNGRSMRGLEVNEVGDIIAGMSGSLVFVLASSPQTNGMVNGRDIGIVKHVRALFDYDAYDDPYLPCRELGLSFQKGDVLRIMSSDDTDWWQAYRDADGDTHLTLAGLVPSQEFQHQREALRISLIKQNNQPESKKSFLCGRKKKKKEKQNLYDENEDDELIQTYEEMALYHQPETRKRPIVLIGPPNVGRHELRQRLVDNDRERFASPVIHTTRAPNDHERNGVDYHFVTVEQFESIRLKDGFLDFGTYQKTLYGTTVQAVNEVIKMEIICVINLHAEYLRTLCTSGLKPYIVFIAPPPLERLRQNMSKEGKQLKEDELRQIIENARDIERRYSHFFDETIRNSDLNRSYAELLRLINNLDTQPQWVPATWLD